MAGDDDRFYNDYHQDEPPEEDPPQTSASVIFTEMMRRAANADAEARALDKDNDINIEDDDKRFGASVVTVAGEAIPTMSDEERQRAAQMESERIRRVKRRREKRRRRNVGVVGGIIRTILVVIISGGLMATILSLWIDPSALDSDTIANLSSANATSESGVQLVTTALPTPNWMITIGIISGHSGPENDPGAVCYGPNNEVLLTETEINFAVSERIFRLLLQQGYDAELLEEFDPRLENYQGAALVSIHANDCSDYGEFVSGYLISFAESRPQQGPDLQLQECIAQYYDEASQLPRRFGFTRDVTDYHVFREISPNTPAVILELGFMRGDQEFLTTQPDAMAQAVVDGIICFLNGEGERLLIDESELSTSEALATPPATTP